VNVVILQFYSFCATAELVVSLPANSNQDSQNPHLCRVACRDGAKLVSRRGISRSSRRTYGTTKSRNETTYKLKVLARGVARRPRSLVLVSARSTNANCAAFAVWH